MARSARFAANVILALAASLSFGQAYVPGQVLVKFKPGGIAVSRSIARLHGRIAGRVAPLGIDRVVLAAGASVWAAVAQLRSDPAIEFAEPDYIVSIQGADDPLLPQQWNLAKIGAQAAWGITKGNPGVLVAMLDSGVDFNHPDLFGKIADSRNFVGTGIAFDGNGHGTHTAGTVAARTDNGLGVAALGYDTRLLIAKVLDDSGQGDVFTVAQGLDWAVTSGAKVINMSLAMTSFSQVFEDAVDSAWNHGLVVVAAAGNGGGSQPMYPGAFAHCIAVAATDQLDGRCSFSTFGPWVHVAAPGNQILSTFTGGSYKVLSGTSMAAPQVAALAALMWANGARSNSAIRTAIETSGQPTLGFGRFPALRINPRRALMRLP